MGLVNWVCAAAERDAAVASVLERLRHQAPTANAHIKRLLHESFHRDPRAYVEEVMRRPARVHGLVGDRRGQPRVAREARAACFHPRPLADVAADVILETHGLTKEFRGFVAVQGRQPRACGAARSTR